MRTSYQLTLIALICFVLFSQSTHAAESLLPIHTRIIRCVSHEERLQMCAHENLCCNLLDKKSTAVATTGNAPQPIADIFATSDKVFDNTATRFRRAKSRIEKKSHTMDLGINLLRIKGNLVIE